MAYKFLDEIKDKLIKQWETEIIAAEVDKRVFKGALTKADYKANELDTFTKAISKLDEVIDLNRRKIEMLKNIQ